MSKNTNLIIGKVESGKTRGVCFQEIETAIKDERNLFILDHKEEYYPRFKEELEQHGYQTWLINLRDPLKSNGVNILKYPYLLYKNNDKDTSIYLVTSIARNICISSENDFWENNAADYLASLLLILFEHYDMDEVNFMNLGILIHLFDHEEGIELLRNYFQNLDVTSLIYKLGSTTIFAPADTRGGIISTLKYKVNAFFHREEVLTTLSMDELDLSNLGHKVAIFFEGKSGLNGIANILLEELTTVNQDLNQEFVFMLDPFNSLPKLSFIDELIEYGTLNKTKTYFVTNCFDELVDLYGKYRFEKIANVVHMDKVENVSIDLEFKNAVYPTRIHPTLKTIDINKLRNHL